MNTATRAARPVQRVLLHDDLFPPTREWSPDDTRGAGLLFTGQKSTASGLVKGLVREWKSAGHLPR